ncbi:MAG: hypothetical protein RIB59_17390 [Rhodospirillales bacterium]
MLDKLFSQYESKIDVGKDATVLNARTGMAAALTFCTLAFLVFFIAEYKGTTAKIGKEIWWVAMVLGAISLHIGIGRLRDARPLMIITKNGLAFPRLFSDVIPWADIAEIKFSRSMITINFKEDKRLKWYPRFTLVPGDPGFAGDGFFAKYEVPWVRVRINYMWPATTENIRQLIDNRRPKSMRITS